MVFGSTMQVNVKTWQIFLAGRAVVLQSKLIEKIIIFVVFLI